jgi:hypothetical protein
MINIIKQERSKDTQALYLCTLHGEFYGIIGTYTHGSANDMIKQLLKNVPKVDQKTGSELNRLVERLICMMADTELQHRESNFVFRLMNPIYPISSKRLSFSSSVYPISHRYSCAFNCYITEGKYFGDLEDIRQLSVVELLHNNEILVTQLNELIKG